MLCPAVFLFPAMRHENMTLRHTIADTVGWMSAVRVSRKGRQNERGASNSWKPTIFQDDRSAFWKYIAVIFGAVRRFDALSCPGDRLLCDAKCQKGFG